jgi:hypothetical protein
VHVFDLEHDALVRLIGDCQRLGDQPVEPGPLKLGEPSLRGRQIGGRRSDVGRWPAAGQCVDEGGTPLAERPPGVVDVAERQHVECDERCGRLLGKHAYP